MITVLVVAASLCTCTEDDLRPSVIRFDAEKQSLTEGSEAKIILTLDKPAYRSCTVRIKLETNAVYGDHYTSTPEIEADGTFVVTVAKGESSASFNITSIDNSLFDNGKFMLFTLMKPTEGLALASTTTSIITFDDDEGPSMVNFDYERMSIGETESFVIEIPLSVAAKGEGSITIGLTAKHAVYGQRFTTIPAPVNNSITMPISANATGTSITFSPIDDELFTGNFEVIFSIAAVSGVLQKGKLTELTALVGDNEQPSIATFASGTETLREEDADGIPIEIMFSAPAAGTGTVSIHFTSPDDYGAVYDTDFVTIPPASGDVLTLPVSLHDKSVTFKVLPINNPMCTDRIAKMTLTSSGGAIITKEETTTSTITIKDADRSILTFQEADGSILESSTDGIDVHATFSKPALENTMLYIMGPTYVSEGNLYGTLYSTDPPMTLDWYDFYLALPVQKGATGVDFTIIPINNNIDNAEPMLVFTLYPAYNSCFVGNGNYTLTIKDDD